MSVVALLETKMECVSNYIPSDAIASHRTSTCTLFPRLGLLQAKASHESALAFATFLPKKLANERHSFLKGWAERLVSHAMFGLRHTEAHVCWVVVGLNASVPMGDKANDRGWVVKIGLVSTSMPPTPLPVTEP
ncbi:unnamed protein product [Protopolystoma xenopodis]|uniref:Uncharacterized protein n=1 Tax=Protopolystoma xenopodis TaxID=117903 RepID=A0A448WY86_9PLAT|nr:unnamed protein product [Protopolystoma xenopodis]